MPKHDWQPTGPTDRHDRPLDRLRQFEAQRAPTGTPGPVEDGGDDAVTAPDATPDASHEDRHDDEAEVELDEPSDGEDPRAPAATDAEDCADPAPDETGEPDDARDEVRTRPPEPDGPTHDAGYG